jgi:hypothetical protein
VPPRLLSGNLSSGGYALGTSLAGTCSLMDTSLSLATSGIVGQADCRPTVLSDSAPVTARRRLCQGLCGLLMTSYLRHSRSPKAEGSRRLSLIYAHNATEPLGTRFRFV